VDVDTARHERLGLRIEYSTQRFGLEESVRVIGGKVQIDPADDEEQSSDNQQMFALGHFCYSNRKTASSPAKSTRHCRVNRSSTAQQDHNRNTQSGLSHRGPAPI